MAQQSYLSTDPNAGEPVRESPGGYLSTDPNAGQPLRDAARSWRGQRPKGDFWAAMAESRGDPVTEESLAAESRGARQPLANVAPVAGGTIGGLAGGIPGAAIGGMVGSRLRQYLNAPEQGLPPAGEAIAENLTSGAVQGGLQAGGALVGAGLKKAAPELMQRALKPTRALLREYRTTAPALVQDLLDEGVAVTRKGLARLQGLLTSTNDDISAAVASAPGSIDKASVATRAVEPALRISRQTNPNAGLATVADEVDAFMNHPVYRGALSPAEAQAMKRATYQEIGDSYGELSNAAKETKKALARGLKEELVGVVPGIDKLNARDAKLIAMTDAVGQRVAQAANANPVGFAWVTNPLASPGHAASFLAALADRSPAIKSHLANAAYRRAAALANVPVQTIRAAMALVASTPEESMPND